MIFNIELPPDSSWKWSTGITTEDQNEINRLESRVHELEAELVRVRVLYAEEVEARIYAEKLLMNEPCTVKAHKALESENDKISELFNAAGVDNNILHERIKVLEDAADKAIRILQSVNWAEGTIPFKAMKVLEVKS